MLVLAQFVVEGERKDRNANGFVCGKPGSDGKVHGGPDDEIVDDAV